jgi:hypothetical protein
MAKLTNAFLQRFNENVKKIPKRIPCRPEISTTMSVLLPLIQSVQLNADPFIAALLHSDG